MNYFRNSPALLPANSFLVTKVVQQNTFDMSGSDASEYYPAGSYQQQQLPQNIPVSATIGSAGQKTNDDEAYAQRLQQEEFNNARPQVPFSSARLLYLFVCRVRCSRRDELIGLSDSTIIALFSLG